MTVVEMPSRGLSEYFGGGIDVMVKKAFLGIGVLLFIAGGFFIFRTVSFMNNSNKVDAKVVSVQTKVHKGKKMSRTTTYKPTFEFTDAGGKSVTATSFETSKSYNFPIGSSVEILYDKNDSTNIKIPTFFSLWLIPTILIPIGLIFFIVGLVGKRK
ncbi:MAG TPA: DUF3592 domain-containing protein [Spirochaetota bacterium]|nr:DUF3592 domain-containing protein [Spirochaetota bacterium]HNT09609.1 DUF3592 domain-containing protein [Spirochaetota bacterium]